MSSEYLFVYGTLMRATDTPMYRHLARHCHYAAPARLPGRLYLLDGYPGAVPSTRAGEFVQGELYRVAAPARLFPALDRYEGCAPGSARPHEYHRCEVEVVLADESRQRAWVYLYARPTLGLKRIPSGDFLHHWGGRAPRRPGAIQASLARNMK